MMQFCKIRKLLPILLLAAVLVIPALATSLPGVSASASAATTSTTGGVSGVAVGGGIAAGIAGALWLLLRGVSAAVAKGLVDLFEALLGRLNIRLSQDRREVLRRHIEDAVRAAEEKYLAGHVEDAARRAALKVQYVVDRVKSKVPDAAADEIDELLHAALQRIDGLGATGPKPAPTAKP